MQRERLNRALICSGGVAWEAAHVHARESLNSSLIRSGGVAWEAGEMRLISPASGYAGRDASKEGSKEGSKEARQDGRRRSLGTSVYEAVSY